MKRDFDALYRSHHGRVFGLCRRLLRGHAEAEEATQEVFMRAYRALAQYDRQKSFQSWVLSIASNHCIDLLRQRARQPGLFQVSDTDVAALQSDARGTLDSLLDSERAAAVRVALAALPDKYRVPIVLAYYNESSYEEIAQQLGITRNHVGVLLLRGRQMLRRALGGSAAEAGQ